MTNNYIMSAKEAFKHVNLSSKFFLLKQNRLKKESEDVLRDIILMSEMNNKEKATVWSIGSAVLMEYGVRYSEKSVHFVKKALQLDPHCAEWYFLLGKVLGIARRVKKGPKGIPEDDEIKALELSVDKSPDPMYKVILAQTYMDMWRALYVHGGFKNTEINDVLEKASLLFRQASKDGDNNAFVLRKCAEGFNKLPGRFKNLQLSKECIVRALEIAPNVAIFHAAGIIFQKENSYLAKQYFMQSIEGGNYASCYRLLKIKYQENESYNPCADIERYLSLFTSDLDKQLFFCWQGAYYYFVKKDFDAALEFWKKLFEFSDTPFVLTDSYCPWNSRSFDISDIIWKEIIERIRCDANQQTKYESILQDLERHRKKNQENRT